MGMYTEIHVAGCVETGSKAEAVIRFLFDSENSGSDGEPPEVLPDHEFFKLPRWTFIGSSSSYYLSPISFRGVKDSGDSLYFHSVSNLKNYDGEIEAFFDWLKSEKIQHYGHSRYEETPEKVTLYNYEYGEDEE